MKPRLALVTSGDLLREARLRAGLSQRDLGSAVGRPHTQIARWERGEVEPSLSTLRALIRACGYDVSLRLETYAEDSSLDGVLTESLRRTPSERVERMLGQPRPDGGADDG